MAVASAWHGVLPRQLFSSFSCGGDPGVDGGRYVVMSDASLICYDQLLEAAVVRTPFERLICFASGINIFISLRYKVGLIPG